VRQACGPPRKGAAIIPLSFAVIGTLMRHHYRLVVKRGFSATNDALRQTRSSGCLGVLIGVAVVLTRSPFLGHRYDYIGCRV
jgi:hypothetical protein